jgi:sortase A
VAVYGYNLPRNAAHAKQGFSSVPRKRYAEELTEEELRHLMMEKRRASRQERLDHFRKTGRVLAINPEPETPTLDGMRSEVIEGDEGAPGENQVTRSPRSRRLLDGLLLVVELAAVIGLILVLGSGANILRNLNKEVASALTLPTLTPTPLITAVVLPGGHTPPNDPEGVKPNESEIPEHLRPLVQSLANVPAPTPSPEQAVRIQISSIKVDAPIVQGDGWEQLKKGVGQHIGSPDPGQDGNIVLSAHNDVFGEIFRDLEKIKIGDQIIIFSQQRQYVYVVTNSLIVLPTQVEVMQPSSDATLTLITCYPYLVDNKRIVVKAKLQENSS